MNNPIKGTDVESDFYNLLQLRSTDLAQKWAKFFTGPFGVSGAVCRNAINNVLRIQIGLLETDTFAARLCLSDEGDYHQWLRNIDRAICPLMIRYDLPKPPSPGPSDLHGW